MNKDLTGREEVIESTHAYFGRIIYFGKKGDGGYWEAERKDSDSGQGYSVIIPAEKDASLDPYAHLAARLVDDMDGLFQRSRLAFGSEWANWVKGPFPAQWRDAFLLDGITLPKSADENLEWSVCYFVEPAHHYWTAVFERGKVREVVVDG